MPPPALRGMPAELRDGGGGARPAKVEEQTQKQREPTQRASPAGPPRRPAQRGKRPYTRTCDGERLDIEIKDSDKAAEVKRQLEKAHGGRVLQTGENNRSKVRYKCARCECVAFIVSKDDGGLRRAYKARPSLCICKRDPSHIALVRGVELIQNEHTPNEATRELYNQLGVQVYIPSSESVFASRRDTRTKKRRRARADQGGGVICLADVPRHYAGRLATNDDELRGHASPVGKSASSGWPT